MLEKDNSGSQGSSFLFTTTATTTIPRAPKKLYRAQKKTIQSTEQQGLFLEITQIILMLLPC